MSAYVVLNPFLLVLLGAVEDRVVADADLLGHLPGDLFTLLAAERVHHGEHAVGPVRVDGALVAVAHLRISSEPVAEVGQLLLRYAPADHAVGGEACLLVAEDGGETPHHAALLEILRPREHLPPG